MYMAVSNILHCSHLCISVRYTACLVPTSRWRKGLRVRAFFFEGGAGAHKECKTRQLAIPAEHQSVAWRERAGGVHGTMCQPFNALTWFRTCVPSPFSST
jgi:hypothetical protein